MRVHCLNEDLYRENRDSVLADGLVLRNPLLRKAAKRTAPTHNGYAAQPKKNNNG